MAPDKIKQSRQTLGLSLSQMSALMDTDERSWRRFEKGDRNPAARVVRLLNCYLTIKEMLPEQWELIKTPPD